MYTGRMAVHEGIVPPDVIVRVALLPRGCLCQARAMPSKMPRKSLPNHFVKFCARHSRVAKAYETLGAALTAEGPLDKKAVALARLAVAIGAREEGGVHS